MIKKKINNFGTFTITINNLEYIYIYKEKIIIKNLVRHTKFLNSIKLYKKLIQKFLNLKFETRNICNKKKYLTVPVNFMKYKPSNFM
jgi:hypothetical protein